MSLIIRFKLTDDTWPEGEPGTSIKPVRATSQNTIRDVKNLLWHHNFDMLPGPGLLRLYNGRELHDSETLESFAVLEVQLDLVIDHSGKAGLERDSYIYDTFFNVEIDVEGRRMTTRETLNSNVWSVMEAAAELLGTNANRITLFHDSHELSISHTLQEALALDVPPKEVRLLAVESRRAEMRLVAKNTLNKTHCDVIFDWRTTVAQLETLLRKVFACDLTLEFPVQTDSLRVSDRLKDEYVVKAVPKTKRVFAGNREWTSTGETLVKVEGERLVLLDALSSRIYTLTVGDVVVRLNTSELLDMGLRVFISPAGQAKLAAVMHETPRNTEPTRTEVQTIEPEVVEEVAEDVVPHEEEQPVREGDSVARRLVVLIRGAGPNVIQWAWQAAFAMFILGEKVSFFFQWHILGVLLGWLLTYTVLLKGEDVANWLDENLTEGAPAGRTDFALVESISQLLHSFSNRVDFVSAPRRYIAQVAPRRLRNEIVERAAEGTDLTWFYVRGTLVELAKMPLLFVATLVPGYEASITQLLADARGRQREEVSLRLDAALGAVQQRPDGDPIIRAIQQRMGFDIYGKLTDEELLQCYKATLEMQRATPEQLAVFCGIETGETALNETGHEAGYEEELLEVEAAGTGETNGDANRSDTRLEGEGETGGQNRLGESGDFSPGDTMAAQEHMR